MDQLDAILGRLAQAPVPDGLKSVDCIVLARIARPTVNSVRAGFGVATVGVALAIGIMGASVPTRDPTVARNLSPLGPISPLAPSVLLMGER